MRFGPILVAVFATACGSSLAGPDAGSTTTGANNGTTTGGVSSSGGATSSGTGGASSTGGATSGGTSTGGSTGAGTSTGGTGTSSGGTSTGGTTTGGGPNPGDPCGADAQCLSGHCGVAGTGNCCTALCPNTSDTQCGGTACDSTGACVYPPNTTPCGLGTCSGSTITSKLCDGAGQCSASGGSGPCPGNFVCKDATSCNNSCTDSTACVSGFYCASNKCVAQKATGPCLSNETCISNICGVKGTGSCCTSKCDTTDHQCGATDCDALGACIFPGGKTSCGASGCSGNTLTSASCDGTGACGAPVATTCPGNLVCADAKTCLTKCATASDCANGDVCDQVGKQMTCCTAPGSTIYVDNATGVDGACCGAAASPCLTLTRAMEMIGATELSGATIIATVKGGGGDWSDKTEVLPIKLAWGVTVLADGVYFTDSSGSTSVFDVNLTSKADTSGFAALQGGGSGPDQVVIGADTTGARLMSTDAAITVQTGMSLLLDNAWVNGNSGIPTNGIAVKAGGTLVIGQNNGQLTIGGLMPNGAATLHGEVGIVCGPGTAKQPATVVDTPNLGFASLVISNQAIQDVDAEDNCTFDVEDEPVFGASPLAAAGFNSCTDPMAQPFKVDAVGVYANGNATVILGSDGNGNVATPATIQCMSGTGIDLEDINGVGGPTLNLVGTVQNADTGLLASTGTATVVASTFQYNYVGVNQLGTASVDLTGLAKLRNTVVCSSNQESTFGSANPGIDVWNQGTNSLAADNVTWDTSQPDYFDCDFSLMMNPCTCKLSSCDTAAGNDDMDAVEDPNRLGGITLTNPTQSSTTSCK